MLINEQLANLSEAWPWLLLSFPSTVILSLITSIIIMISVMMLRRSITIVCYFSYHYQHYQYSGGWKSAIVGVPWRGSVSACLAWRDSIVKDVLEQMLKRLSLLRHHGTPIMAHLQLPESTHISVIEHGTIIWHDTA